MQGVRPPRQRLGEGVTGPGVSPTRGRGVGRGSPDRTAAFNHAVNLRSTCALLPHLLHLRHPPSPVTLTTAIGPRPRGKWQMATQADLVIENYFAEIPNAGTRRGYLNDWNEYSMWLEKENVELTQARPRHVQAFVADINAKRRSRASIGRALSSLRGVYGALVRADEMATNPAREIKPPKNARTPAKAPDLTHDEVARMLTLPRATGASVATGCVSTSCPAQDGGALRSHVCASRTSTTEPSQEPSGQEDRHRAIAAIGCCGRRGLEGICENRERSVVATRRRRPATYHRGNRLQHHPHRREGRRRASG